MSAPWLRRVRTPRDVWYRFGFNVIVCGLVGLGVVLSGGTLGWQLVILAVIIAGVPATRAILDAKSLRRTESQQGHEKPEQ